MGCSPAMVLTLADENKARRERDEWRITDELLAQLHELTQVARHDFLLANGAKRHQLPEFHRIPRPGDPLDRRPPPITPRQFAMISMGVNP